mgnify:CR=1 FL=1
MATSDEDRLTVVNVVASTRVAEELNLPDLTDGLLEDLDEYVPEGFALRLGIRDIDKRIQKLVTGVCDVEIEVEVLGIELLDLGPLVLAEKNVVD